MKTPRDILLEKHRPINGKLDQMRREFVSSLAPTPPWPLIVPLKLWRELILPARRIWTGFAVVWLAIVLVNMSTAEETQSPESALLVARWEQQQKFMAELLTPVDTPERPRRDPSMPRTEHRNRTLPA